MSEILPFVEKCYQFYAFIGNIKFVDENKIMVNKLIFCTCYMVTVNFNGL